jgi:hypothetical protein
MQRAFIAEVADPEPDVELLVPSLLPVPDPALNVAAVPEDFLELESIPPKLHPVTFRSLRAKIPI